MIGQTHTAIGASLSPDDGFYHPANEEEVVWLVEQAKQQRKVLRVRGAAHSVHAAIFSDSAWSKDEPDPFGINVMLDQMRAIHVDRPNKKVTVQTGVNLGFDLEDPSGTSTWENSLFHRLEQEKLALPDTGGIIHQTVGGFLSTGSSGGSLRHSVGNAIIGIRLVDGTGQIHDLSEEHRPDEFHAAGVSLGLLGVVIGVIFRCEDAFHVLGQEDITTVEDCWIDLFGPGDNGKPGLEQAFRDTEHLRLLWWPQKGFDRIAVWRGRRMQDSDYNEETGSKEKFKPKRYQQFKPTLGSTWLSQKLGGLFFSLIRSWAMPGPVGGLTRQFLKLALKPVLGIFVAVDGKEGPQKFWGLWMRTLPMDNQTLDELIPTRFTELWIPVEKTEAVMRTLDDHFRRGGFRATGPYACEVYPTPASRFWLSPAYGHDVVKVDMFWFKKNRGDPVELFYPLFWELLQPFGYRLHWGKYLPRDLAKRLPSDFEHWHEFLRIRQRMDPDQVFVSPYWRRHLDIPFPCEPQHEVERDELAHVEARIWGDIPDAQFAEMVSTFNRHMKTERAQNLDPLMETMVEEPEFVMEYLPFSLPITWWTRKNWRGKQATRAFYRGFFRNFQDLELEEVRYTITLRGIVNTSKIKGRVFWRPLRWIGFNGFRVTMRNSAIFEWDSSQRRFLGERVYFREKNALRSLLG